MSMKDMLEGQRTGSVSVNLTSDAIIEALSEQFESEMRYVENTYVNKTNA